MNKNILCAILLLIPANVMASGLFLAPQGVRPLSRGGAFVAGADDVNAMTYNPAGISEAKNGGLIDLTLPIHTTTYQRWREGQVNDTYYPSVEGKGLGLPSPTIGGVYGFARFPQLKFGASASAPVPLMQNWPSTVDGRAAPQRYAIENFKGTALLKTQLAIAYTPHRMISLGAAFTLMAGLFESQMTASGCDGVTCSNPENPLTDVAIQIKSNLIMAPGAHLGIILRPLPWLRLGASWESAYRVNVGAKFNVRLPESDAYSGAVLNPSTPKGKIAFELPQVARVGIEFRFLKDNLRWETTYVWENWAAHDQIKIGLGGAVISNIIGLGQYAMRDVVLDRGFKNSWSIRTGAEWSPTTYNWTRGLTLRAGFMYEPTAIPNAKLTAMNVDLDKFLATAGLTYQWRKWFVQASYAHVFMVDRTVTSSSIYQTNPTDYANRTPIGNGTYSSTADIVGLGLGMYL